LLTLLLELFCCYYCRYCDWWVLLICVALDLVGLHCLLLVAPWTPRVAFAGWFDVGFTLRLIYLTQLPHIVTLWVTHTLLQFGFYTRLYHMPWITFGCPLVTYSLPLAPDFIYPTPLDLDLVGWTFGTPPCPLHAPTPCPLRYPLGPLPSCYLQFSWIVALRSFTVGLRTLWFGLVTHTHARFTHGFTHTVTLQLGYIHCGWLLPRFPHTPRLDWFTFTLHHSCPLDADYRLPLRLRRLPFGCPCLAGLVTHVPVTVTVALAPTHSLQLDLPRWIARFVPHVALPHTHY